MFKTTLARSIVENSSRVRCVRRMARFPVLSCLITYQANNVLLIPSSRTWKKLVIGGGNLPPFSKAPFISSFPPLVANRSEVDGNILFIKFLPAATGNGTNTRVGRRICAIFCNCRRRMQWGNTQEN